MSFGFTIAEDEWEQREMPLRTINRIADLFEITFTPIPAYPTTEVAMRSLEAATEVEVPVLEEVVTEEAPAAEVEAEPVAAEAATEVVDAPSTEDTSVESPTLSTTKAEMTEYLLSLLK